MELKKLFNTLMELTLYSGLKATSFPLKIF